MLSNFDGSSRSVKFTRSGIVTGGTSNYQLAPLVHNKSFHQLTLEDVLNTQRVVFCLDLCDNG